MRLPYIFRTEVEEIYWLLDSNREIIAHMLGTTPDMLDIKLWV